MRRAISTASSAAARSSWIRSRSVSDSRNPQLHAPRASSSRSRSSLSPSGSELEARDPGSGAASSRVGRSRMSPGQRVGIDEQRADRARHRQAAQHQSADWLHAEVHGLAAVAPRGVPVVGPQIEPDAGFQAFGALDGSAEPARVQASARSRARSGARCRAASRPASYRSSTERARMISALLGIQLRPAQRPLGLGVVVGQQLDDLDPALADRLLDPVARPADGPPRVPCAGCSRRRRRGRARA